MENFETLNWREAAAKARSKREVYNLMVRKGELYLCPESEANADYVYDVLTGRKKVSNFEFNPILVLAKEGCWDSLCSHGRGAQSFRHPHNGKKARRDRRVFARI